MNKKYDQTNDSEYSYNEIPRKKMKSFIFRRQAPPRTDTDY